MHGERIEGEEEEEGEKKERKVGYCRYDVIFPFFRLDVNSYLLSQHRCFFFSLSLALRAL
jgi:hypothetical protein